MSVSDPQRKALRRFQRSSFLPRLPSGRPGKNSASHPCLAEAEMGELVQVTNIFFEMVRNRCWKLGILEGEVYRCLGFDESRGTLLLFHPVHGRVRVEKDVARFVSTTLINAVA